MRRDGSSRFGPGNQYGNFWSIGAGWILSEELFKDNNAVSFAKIKGSYGSSGNDGIGDYRYLELYQAVSNSLTYDGVSPISSVGATNPYYHWEDIRKLEIGIELGFLEDRIFVSTNYFRTRSTDQLGEFLLPATSGASAITVNRTAAIQNAGLEIVVSSAVLKHSAFKWNTDINIGLTRDKLLKLPIENASLNSFGLNPSTLYKEGEPFNRIWIRNIFAGVNPSTGLYQFVDKSGNLSLTNLSETKLLSTVPKYQGGINNTFNYRGFGFSFFVEFKKQLGLNYLYGVEFLEAGRNTSNLPKEYLKRWHEYGQQSNFQRLSNSGMTTGQLAFSLIDSDIRYVDASYIRLNNVALSYDFPQTWGEYIGVKKISANMNVQNLLTLTPYKGLDPQTQSVSVLPQWRTIVFGIQLKL